MFKQDAVINDKSCERDTYQQFSGQLEKRVVNHKARDIEMWYWSVDARPKKKNSA